MNKTKPRVRVAAPVRKAPVKTAGDKAAGKVFKNMARAQKRRA